MEWRIMSFGSLDYLIQRVTEGYAVQHDGSKVTGVAHTAGGWHALFGLAGYPNASTYPGTDLVFKACTEAGGDGATILGAQHAGAIESAGVTKHLLNLAGLLVAAAGAPWQLKLVDLEGYYRLSTTNVTGTGSRVLINSETFTANAGTDLLTYAQDWAPYTKVQFTTTTTLPAPLALLTDYWLIRASATTATVATSYANAVAGAFIDITTAGTGTHTLTIQMRNEALNGDNGAGVEAFFVAQTQPTAGGPTLSASSYTNSAGTAGRAFQGPVTFGATADAYATRVLHSGNAAGRYGPFLPKQGADAGIRSVQSFTWSAGTAYTGSGVVALCLARPLADIMIPQSGALTEKDVVNQLMSMPKIRDGACLGWMLFGTGATTAASPLTVTTNAAWG
jgi:hypothetical protein